MSISKIRIVEKSILLWYADSVYLAIALTICQCLSFERFGCCVGQSLNQNFLKLPVNAESLFLYYNCVRTCSVNISMSNQATTTTTVTATDDEVVCNHKPGDVWADGCCQSKKNKAKLEGERKEAELLPNAAKTIKTATEFSQETVE